MTQIKDNLGIAIAKFLQSYLLPISSTTKLKTNIMADATRSQKQKALKEEEKALKEDVKQLLEELWKADKEDALYKVFTKNSKMGMTKFLGCSKDDLKGLSCVEDDGAVLKLETHEVSDVRVLVHYRQHLIANGLFPHDANAFRFNSTSRRDWINFVCDPSAMALLHAEDTTAKGLHIKSTKRNEFHSTTSYT